MDFAIDPISFEIIGASTSVESVGMSIGLLEWGVGALFIIFHAFKRYSTPASNRCSTTYAQFVVYGFLYCLTMVLIYLFLAAVLDSSPETIQIFKNFLDISGQWTAFDGIDFVNQSKPFVSALLVITVFPNAPWLKNFDEWLLQVFWDLGRIPVYVKQQAESLRLSGYIIDPGKRKELKIYARKYGIDIKTLTLDNWEKGDFSWAKLASLQLSLDRWRRSANGRTRRFISDNEREYSQIKNMVDDLSYQFASNRSGDSQDDGSIALLEKEITATYRLLTEFVARILLISERYQSDIQKRIRELGFGDMDFHSRGLSANQMVLILASMFVSFLVLSFLFNRVLSDNPRTMLSVLNESLLMMLTYGAAVSCALLIKSKPVFSYNELTSQNPWLGYVLSGMLAIFTWALVAWSYRYIELMLRTPVGGGKATIEGLVVPVLKHLEWSYPYMLQSFVIAMGLSLLVDRRIPYDKNLIVEMKIVDTVFLTIQMMFISLIVYQWMFGIFLFHGLQTKDLEYIKPEQVTLMAQVSFMLEHGIIGAIIGFLVPHWYRTNRSDGSYDSVARMILMNKEELNNEARNLKPGALLQVFTSISLWVGSFEKQFDRNELEVFEVTMTQLSGLNSADFSIEEAHNFLSANRGKVTEEFLKESLGAIKASKKIQTLCCWYALSLAYADHYYSSREEEKILQIFSLLTKVDELYLNNAIEFSRNSAANRIPEDQTEV